MKAVKANQKTTLLLNNAWQPITVITARAAFQHLYKKRVTSVDKNMGYFHTLDTWNELAEFYDDQPYITSPNNAWPIPTIVIVTSKFFRRPQKAKLSLHELAKICDFKCQYCFEKFPLKELTIDHVRPKSKGGEDVHANRVLACGTCNRKKGSLTPFYDLNGKIPKPPAIPKFMLDVGEIRSEWKPLIGLT
jgi:5-methylcytosine-specific restriction endonuclease McrA